MSSTRSFKVKHHRELYPDQYVHDLCGKTAVTKSGHVFVIYRVVRSMFGLLAVSESDPTTAYSVNQIKILDHQLADYRFCDFDTQLQCEEYYSKS